MRSALLTLALALTFNAAPAFAGTLSKKDREEACSDIQVQGKRVVFGNGQSFKPGEASAPLRACGLKMEAVSADAWARKRRNAWIWSGVGLLVWPAFVGTGFCAVGASQERKELEIALAEIE